MDRFRGLDESSQARITAWAEIASAHDYSRVFQVLQDVEQGRDWKYNWYVRQDVFGDPHTWIIEPDPGLVVMIREFSDEDPEHSFAVVAVGRLD